LDPRIQERFDAGRILFTLPIKMNSLLPVEKPQIKGINPNLKRLFANL
jgi:hypothetical protein